MNLYELAKETVNSNQVWASGKGIELFSNTSNAVYVNRTQHGKVTMFITVKNNIKKNAKVANINLEIGYPGNFNCTQANYQSWVKKVQRAL